MADFVVDTFTGSDDTNLPDHTGETGATWTKAVGDSSNHLYIQGNALAGTGGSTAIYYASGTPASADYDVSANIVFLNNAGNVLIGILGRLSTDGNNYYRLDYNGFSNTFVLSKNVSGSGTVLESEAWVEDDQLIKLEMRSTTIKGYIDGVETFSQSDSGVSDAGRVGCYKFAGVSDAADFYRIGDITGSDAEGGGEDPSILPLVACDMRNMSDMGGMRG